MDEIENGDPIFEDVKYNAETADPVFEDVKYKGKKSTTVKSSGKPLKSKDQKITDDLSKIKINKRGVTPVEDPRDVTLRYNNDKGLADQPNDVLDVEVRNKLDKKINKFDKEFRPKIYEIKDYVSLTDDSNASKIIQDLKLGQEYTQDVEKAITDRDNKLKFYNNQSPYIDYSNKNQEVDFVDKYYGRDNLIKMGINPDDFDGYLEINEKKSGLKDLDERGFFSEDHSGISDEKLNYDLQRLNLINQYYEDNTARDKSLAYEYLRRASNGSKDAKVKYQEVIQRLQNKTEGYQNFIAENLPTYVAHEQTKLNNVREQYKKYKEGNADEFLNWGRGAWEGIVQSINGISATVYDKIGAKDIATGIRLQSDQEKRYDAAPDLYYVSETGRKVNYNGTNYIVTSNGEVIDTDDKLRATSVLSSQDYNEILKKSEQSSELETSTSIGGTVQQSSGVIGDMAVQLLLTKGVTKATGLVKSGVTAARNSEVMFAVENSLAKTSIGKSMYSRAAANALDSEILNTGSLMSKASKIPSIYGDVLITQGAYGYSTGYENTYNAMIEKGYSDDKAREAASEAGTQMAALYGATSFIAPQTNILNALESKSINSLIRKGISEIDKNGLQGFSRVLSTGVKDMLKNTSKNGITILEEAGKEVVQENVQQFGENEIVNSNINEIIGEDLLKDTYTLEDFKNTTALAFSSALMLNSPTLVKGVDRMSILNKLLNNKEGFESSLETFVKSGYTTREKAETLKKNVEIYSKYRNMLPTGTNNLVAFEAMSKLEDIDKTKIEMEMVHPAFKEAYKKRIETKEQELDQILKGTELETEQKTQTVPKPKEVEDIQDSGIITDRDEVWDTNTKSTLPESRYESEEDFKTVIQKGKWGMLTAENPDAIQISDDQNFNNNEKAVQWLKEKGYKPQSIFGKYGSSENSFFVENLTKEDAVEFAKEFKQESVATNEGLVYQDGTMNPRIKGSESFESKPDFYSSIKIGDKNVDYSIDYDFENKVENVSLTNEGNIEETSVNTDENETEKFKQVAEKIRNAKFYKTPSDALNRLNTDLTAPLKLAWDGTMEIIATSVEQSGNLNKAIKQGIKYLKTTDWYKQLSSDVKSKAIETFTSEATTNFKPFSDSIVKDKTNSKKIIREKTGQTDNSKEVVTSEKKLLKLKYKLQEQAQRMQRSFDNKNRSSAVANLRQLVETLSKNSTVTSAILKSMLKGAVNLNTSDEKAVKKFMEKVSEIISRVNDKTNISQLRKLKRTVRNLPKTAPANIRELGKDSVNINEKYLSSSEIETYIGILEEIKNSNAPVQGKTQKMVDVDQAYSDLEDLAKIAETNRFNEIIDSLALLGIDQASLNMTDSELRNFWDTEINVDGSTLEDKKQQALDKAEKIIETLKTIASVYKSSLVGFDFDSITSKKSKEIAKKLPQANLDFMDAVSLKEYIKAVQNLTTNNNLSGSGKIASQIEATNGMIKFVTKVVESGVPLGELKVDTKLTKGNFLNDLKSLSLLIKQVYKTPELMGDFNYYSGLASLSKNKVTVDREISNTTKELDLLFKELSSKNKTIRSSENTMMRGIVSNLIQGNTEEEFNINRARIEDNISKADKYSDEMQTIYDEYKGFKNQQEVLDHLKSRNDGNYDIVMFWMDKFKNIKEDLKENTEVVHNEIFNEVSENYLPIKIKVDGSLDLEQGGSIYNYGGISSPKQSGTTIKRNKSKKLPANGVLDLDFDSAMLNRYRIGLYDINTSKPLQVVKSFFGSKQIKSLMGKNNTQVFVKRINYMQRLSAGTLNEISDSERAISRVERIFKRIGVTAALGGVTAIIKQTIPVMTQVAVQVGSKNVGTFISNFRVAQNNTLINDYSTSMRGESILGTKSIMDSANDLNKYKGFTGGISEISRKAGQFFDKTRNVLMTPLQYGDQAVAKASWTTYYLEFLKNNGIDISKVDISREHELIDNDEVRQRAASYAEVRVEETQVASDNERSASLFNNPHIGVAALRSIFLPFQQFNINSKMRMLLDISEIMNTRKNGKFAEQFSNMTEKETIENVLSGNMLNNKHVTLKGKNSSLSKSIRSLGATITEQVMFQGIKAFALTLFTSNAAALFKFLIDDSEDSDDMEHQEWLDKGIDWDFKTKQFYSNLTKDLNPLLIGNFMEDKQIDALNRFHYLFGNDSEEFETYKQWADAYKKENKSLPFYSYDNKGQNVYGIYSIPVDIGSQIFENADFAYDGEAYITNDWDKEEKYILDNKSQLRFMRMMFVMEVLRSTTGVEADSYRELEKVRRELLKISKEKK